jgi:hypothetical protein
MQQCRNRRAQLIAAADAIRCRCGSARSSILDAVGNFKASGRFDHRVVSDLRVIERQVVRLDHDVGLR